MALELRFTIPGQAERRVPLDQLHMKIGALLSNQVVLRAPGIDPIHALIEEGEDHSYVITDLGSATGVKVNGKLIDVEAPLAAGDTISVGSLSVKVVAVDDKIAGASLSPGSTTVPAASAPKGGLVASRPAVLDQATVRASTEVKVERREDTVPNGVGATGDTGASHDASPDRKKDMLFSPRKARPGGDVLEVVAYWGETVLEVELFHPTYKDFDKVTIGDPTKAHLIAAGPLNIDVFQLARFSSGGFKLSLKDGMKTRLRKGGKVEKIDKAGEVSLGNRDIAHIKYGAVSYFLMFVRPPALDFPDTGPRDPLFIALLSVAMLFYFILVPVAWLHTPAPVKTDKDDIWQVVQVPETAKKPEEEKKKEPEKPKPKIKIAEVKTPPKTPPPPKPPEVVKPVKPVEVEKPVQQPKPVEKPVDVKKPTEALKPTPAPAKPAEKPAEKAAPDKPKANALDKLKVGMPSAKATNPDFKLAGPVVANKPKGKAGGDPGSGMKQTGGAIKGNTSVSVKGVEDVPNPKPAGVNLGKLGLGVGKIMSKTAPGAIATNFKDSAGGAGGGSGSASKTYGIGGVGGGKSLGISGAEGAVNGFGNGAGGLLSGGGGSGGKGGSGLGPGFGGGGKGGKGGTGHSAANIVIPPGDPVVSGGLTSQEIMAVIRANLNQIRHCYEQLLQRSPNATGKMGTTFVIDTGGRVSSVNVAQDTINDAMMRGCVTSRIQRWEFPKPRGGQPVTVNYPFVFNPL